MTLPCLSTEPALTSVGLADVPPVVELSRASKKAMMPMTPAAAMTTARTVPSTLRTTGLVNIRRDYTTLGRPLRLRQTDGRARRPVRRPARGAPRGRAGTCGDAAGLLRRPHPSGPERP